MVSGSIWETIKSNRLPADPRQCKLRTSQVLDDSRDSVAGSRWPYHGLPLATNVLLRCKAAALLGSAGQERLTNLR
jgi:hypothetical protein